MDKKQAAEFLGVSPRTLERYTTQKKLSVTYRQGKTAAEAVYDEAELQRFKDALENKTFPTRPAVEQKPGDEVQALVASARATGLTEAVGSFKDELIEALRALKPGGAPVTVAVPVSEKLMLSLKEASALAGISRDRLLAAIESGKLKASKDTIGRGWRVKRDDLDIYVKKL